MSLPVTHAACPRPGCRGYHRLEEWMPEGNGFACPTCGEASTFKEIAVATEAYERNREPGDRALYGGSNGTDPHSPAALAARRLKS